MKCEILEKTLDSLEKFIEKHEKHSTPNQSLSSNLENLMSSFFQPISENIKQEESSELKKIFQNSILKLIEEQSSEVNQSNDEKIQVFNQLPEIMNSQIYNLFIMSIKEKLGMSFIYLNLHF
jgi:ribosomal protein S20